MTIKRQTCNIFVCLMVVVIDITAGILGIEAEVAQSKVSLLKVWIFECRYPSYEAFKLGLAATALLVLAHAISNLLGGCGFCIRSKEELHKSSSNKQLAFASLIIQWIVLAISFSILIMGVLGNSRSRKTCGISREHYFSVGGILCFIHALFSLSYYIAATAAAVAPPQEVEKNIKLTQQVGHA
ncbi:unnamed protein product [Cuscuta epithymum]|uniref:Uncharacterized protein n=1 Tax=Cuscuta epithymum TaxID=186058 RepID=A0AAV0FV33_9ASTE|nr:unnamed protein product [Cuscuta epithymum]